IIHVLRTRSPVYSPLRAFSLDLHVLGTPPAFVLSQDQTLQLNSFGSSAPGLTYFKSLHSKHCGVRNLLRGLAIRFSKTERHCTDDSGRPTASPGSTSGARFLPLCAAACQGHRFRPRSRPQTTGGAGCNTPPPGCQEPPTRAS